MNITLSNKNKKIIGYTLVSDEDYEILKQYKWYKNNGYVVCFIKNKLWKLHRYIMIEILKHNITFKTPIDHINNNPLDNRRENLRLATHSENSRNKKKKENCTSKYIGVSKFGDKFKVSIRIDKYISAYYDNEEHAAYQYNLWIDEFKIKGNKNQVCIPENFVKWISSRKNNLPIGISKYNDKFRVRITNQ